MYELTKKGCLCLASGYNANLRMKIINRWEELETKEQKSNISLPQTYLEALKALVASEEAKEQALLEAKEQRERADRLIHDVKTYTSSEIAKELGFTSAKVLNKKLAELKIQFKQNGTWLLYSQYSDCGYTSIKQIPLDNGHITYDRRWTGVGRDFLLSLFNKG